MAQYHAPQPIRGYTCPPSFLSNIALTPERATSKSPSGGLHVEHDRNALCADERDRDAWLLFVTKMGNIQRVSPVLKYRLHESPPMCTLYEPQTNDVLPDRHLPGANEMEDGIISGTSDGFAEPMPRENILCLDRISTEELLRQRHERYREAVRTCPVVERVEHSATAGVAPKARDLTGHESIKKLRSLGFSDQEILEFCELHGRIRRVPKPAAKPDVVAPANLRKRRHEEHEGDLPEDDFEESESSPPRSASRMKRLRSRYVPV